MSGTSDTDITAEHRSTQRYNLKSINAQYDGEPCEIVDVSPTGMLLRIAGADSLERGDVITINLSVPLMRHMVPMDVDGFVIENSERGLAFDYARPAQTWKHVLRILDKKEHDTE